METTVVQNQIDLSDIQKGDGFSEISHYTYTGKTKPNGNLVFLHHGSKSEVSLSPDYVGQLLTPANFYEKEVKVGKLDKTWTQRQIDSAVKKGELADDHKVRVGDLRLKGIKTLFEEIHSQTVFLCCFRKVDKPLSTRAYNKLLQEQIDNAVAEIEKTRKAKKGVATKAAEIIKQVQENPILPYTPGESRILMGYKLVFDSLDGNYNCMDMNPDVMAPRNVNINTLQWLIVNGIKYILE